MGTEGIKEYLAKAYLNQKYSPNNIEDTYGSTKILLPGNDVSVNDFVKEYAEVCLEEMSDYNYRTMRENIKIFLVPNQHNSIVNWIAAREPIYRQSVA